VETPEVPFGPSAVATPIVVAPPASTIAPGTQIDITQALPIAWRFIFRDPRADFKRRNETPIRARLIVRAVQDDRYLLDVAGMNGEFYHQGWISKSDLEQAIASGNARPVAP
jgi:hypothetical protein